MTDATGCTSIFCEYFDFGSGQDSLCSSFIFPISGIVGWTLVADAYGIPPFQYGALSSIGGLEGTINLIPL